MDGWRGVDEGEDGLGLGFGEWFGRGSLRARCIITDTIIGDFGYDIDLKSCEIRRSLFSNQPVASKVAVSPDADHVLTPE